ncbi:hypothetical protein ACLOJK_000336 [Asimina triloba]
MVEEDVRTGEFEIINHPLEPQSRNQKKPCSCLSMATVALSTHFFSQPSFPRSSAFPSAPAAHVGVASHSHKSSPPALSQIEDSGIIACLRATSAEVAKEAAHAALEGGISVLEIVVSTPGVFEVVQTMPSIQFSDAITVGTVLNIRDARNCAKSGAKFLMSPATVKEISDCFHGTEVLYIPGAMTPTEVFDAYNAGAKIVKVYPISALGGAKYISALKKPFFNIPMVASQGITIDSIEAYISGGASAVVLSDAIFDKEAMRQKNFNAIFDLARLATSHGYKAVNSIIDTAVSYCSAKLSRPM